MSNLESSPSIQSLNTLKNSELNKLLPSTFSSIDGLRGFACLIVLVHHCYFHAGSYKYPVIEFYNLKFSLSSLLFYGYSGVELFFILSGFCLAYSIIKRPNQSTNWKQYWTNRIRRIYPPFLISMLCLGFLSWVIHSLKIEPFHSDNFLAMPSFKQWMYSLSFTSLSFNTSFWTLCVEWRWYIILPLVMYFYRKIHILGLLILSIFISMGYTLFILNSPYESLRFILSPLPWYLPVFILGICVADLIVKNKDTNFGTILTKYSKWFCLSNFILAIVLVPKEPDLELSYLRIFSFGLFYSSLLTAAIFDRFVNRIFSSRPLVFIGKFSYSLYLIHLPIIHAIHTMTKSLNWTEQSQFIFYQGFVMPLCIFLGYVFYQFAERPFLRKKYDLDKI